MDPVSIAILLGIGLVVGSIVDRILHFRQMRVGGGLGSLIQTAILGAVGSVVGTFAGFYLGLIEDIGLNIPSFIAAICGTLVVTLVIGFITRK